MPESWQQLAFKNAHPRDKFITFYEPTHTYTIKGSSDRIISGTGFLHQFFGHFDAKAILKKMFSKPEKLAEKYRGKTPEQIEAEWSENGRQASEMGTAVHLAIEQFLNGSDHLIPKTILLSPEWRYFMNFWNDHGHDLEPYRTEWEVWSEEHLLCGSIDMVFRRKSDGKFLIYDWKRSKEIKTDNRFENGYGPTSHLPNCNYWHYTLQLNVYKWFLETYYGLEIADLYIVILHPDNTNYRRMRLNMLPDEVKEMLDCRKRALDLGVSQPIVLPL
jgi:ATP-dependent exoDNAse (exonuclease V) beta subunit